MYLLEGGYAGVYADWEDSVFCLPEEVKAAYRENCTEEWKKERQDAETFLSILMWQQSFMEFVL